MALSYFDAQTFNIEYTSNRYMIRKLGGDSFLITTEHGAWVVLNREEYDLLRLECVEKDPNLFHILERKGIIITSRNIDVVIDLYRKKKLYLFAGTNLNIISLTSRCNHRCIYCYASSLPVDTKGGDMDEDTAKAVVDFIFQSPSHWLTIELSGGEPLLNFPVAQFIIDYSKELNKKFKKNIEYRIVTNLTRMDEDILKYFVENNVGMSTSLDGPKELHDKNRKYLDGASSYDDVVYWIDVIKSQHKQYLGALPVITKYSLDYGREIVDEYVKHDLGSLRLKHTAPVGYARAWDTVGYSLEEYMTLWKDVLDYILSLNRKGIPFSEGMTTLFLKKIIDPVDPNYVDLCMPCGAVISQITYDDKGDIYTCDEARNSEIFKLGNVKETTYRDVLGSQTTLGMVDLSSCYSFLCDDCAWKPYCGTCVVCTYSAQGGMVNKLPLDFKCKANGEMIEHIFRKLIFSKNDMGILMEWVGTRRY